MYDDDVNGSNEKPHNERCPRTLAEYIENSRIKEFDLLISYLSKT